MMRDRIIGTVTTQRDELPTNHDSFPGKNKKWFSSPKCPDPLWDQPVPYSVGYVDFYLRENRPVCVKLNAELQL